VIKEKVSCPQQLRFCPEKEAEWVDLDPASVDRIEIAPPTRAKEVHCFVAVRNGSKTVATLERRVLISDPATARIPGGWEPHPPRIEGTFKEVKLGGEVRDVVLAGGGRYLVLLLRNPDRLALFEVNKAEVVSRVDLDDHDVLIAAGTAKLFLVSNSKNRIQRWDLAKLKFERSEPLRGLSVTAIAVGNDSPGPVLAYGSNSVRADTVPRLLTFFNAHDLKPYQLPISPEPPGFQPDDFLLMGNQFNNINIRASANGGVYSAWTSGDRRAVVYVISGKGKRPAQTLQLFQLQSSRPAGIGHASPGPDGATIYTGTGGLVSVRGNAPLTQPDPADLVFFPSTVPDVFLGVGGLTSDNSPPGERDYGGAYERSTATGIDTSPRVFANVYRLGSPEPLARTGYLTEMHGERLGSGLEGHLCDDKRFFLIPQVGLLISIPSGNDRLVLRKVDLDGSG
jgi:hypothetical protein